MPERGALATVIESATDQKRSGINSKEENMKNWILVALIVLLSALGVFLLPQRTGYAQGGNGQVDLPQLNPVVIGPMKPLIRRSPVLWIAAPDSPAWAKRMADIVAEGFSLNAFNEAVQTLSPTCGTIVLLPGTHNLGDTPAPLPTSLIDGGKRYVALRDCVDWTGYGSLTEITIQDPSDGNNADGNDVLVFHTSELWERGTWGVQDVYISRMKINLFRPPVPARNNRHAFGGIVIRDTHFSDIWVIGGEENFQTSENKGWGRFIPTDNTYRNIRCEYSGAACIEFQTNTRNALVEDFYCFNCGIDEGSALHIESDGIDNRPQNITFRRLYLEDTSGLGRWARVVGVNGMLVEDAVMKGMGPWELNTTWAGGTRIENVTFRRVSSDGPLYRVRGDIEYITIEE